jgi:protein tyrosine phosphatase
MPWIQNVSLDAVKKRFHFEPGINSMLIQIVDPDMDWPTPAHNFKEVHQFKFLDIEDEHEFSIKDADAKNIVRHLQHAFDNRMNVIVHCVAGVCRSGAVCEVGVMMGFDDPETYRSPNLLVKHKLMRELGWTYD